MPENLKNQQWDDAIAELKRDFSLLHKKYGALDSKLGDLNSFTNHFHDATEKAEKMHSRDI